MTNEEVAAKYDVVWSGADEIIGLRDSKPGDTWRAPNRKYNKTGFHFVKGDCLQEPGVDRVCEKGAKGCIVIHRQNRKPPPTRSHDGKGEQLDLFNVVEDD